MIIAEPRFSASLVSGENDVLKFDDIGCAAHYQMNQPGPPERFWVHDFLTEQWVDGKAAFFVYSGNLVTPMGYGLAAFSSREDADKFMKKENGRLIFWQEIPEILRDKTWVNKGRDLT